MIHRILYLLAFLFLCVQCQPRRAADTTQTPTSNDARQELRSKELMEPTAQSHTASAASTGSSTPSVIRDEGNDVPASPPPSKAETSGKNVISEEILKRKAQTREVEVQHILLSWSDVEEAYAQRGGQDRRGTQRSKDEADGLALSILQEELNGEDFAALMRKYSEDSSTSQSGRADVVTQDALLLAPFKELALRLKSGETGVTQSQFGYHILHRVK